MPFKDPEKRREWKRAWNHTPTAKTYNARFMRERSESNRDWLRDLKGTLSCAACSESHPATLDFHHRDPADKRFTVSQMRNWPRYRIEEEIAKCDVLCANCHRKLHADA